MAAWRELKDLSQPSSLPRPETLPTIILVLPARSESDALMAQRRGFEAAELLGFAPADQEMVAERVTEAFRYMALAGGVVRVEFRVEHEGALPMFVVVAGQQSLLRLPLPPQATAVTADRLRRVSAELAINLQQERRMAVETGAASEPASPSGGEFGEVERIRRELDETNRGVLALYAELDESSRQWQTTFDAIGSGLALLDAGGRIIRCNQALSRITGWSAGAIIGRRPEEVLAEVFADFEPPAPAELHAHRRRQSRILVAPPLSGRPAGDLPKRWFEVVVDPVADPAGRFTGSVLIISDVSQRRRLEEEERQAERRRHETQQLRAHADRMGALEKVKTEFMNLASHELRGPVSVLHGYLSMFEDGSLGPLSERMSAVMPVLLAKLREMDEMIDQMLEAARLEDSRLVLALQPSDLRGLAQAAHTIVAPKAAAGHTIVVEAPGEEVAVMVDRSRATTIIANLLDNAVKYSPEGGEVRCRIRKESRFAELEVSDTGLGISADDMPRLFTRFGRLVTAENSHISGTGLGLYLSRELARMHGGEIEASSLSGQGSTFTLSLPLAASPEA